MSFRWSRAGAIAQKEMYHVLRDRFTLLLSIALPVFMVFAFGYAIEFNVKNIPLSVHDADKTQASRRVIDTFASSGYFIIGTAQWTYKHHFIHTPLTLAVCPIGIEAADKHGTGTVPVIEQFRQT